MAAAAAAATGQAGPVTVAGALTVQYLDGEYGPLLGVRSRPGLLRLVRLLVLVALTELEWCGCWLQREHPATPRPPSHRRPHRHD